LEEEGLLEDPRAQGGGLLERGGLLEKGGLLKRKEGTLLPAHMPPLAQIPLFRYSPPHSAALLRIPGLCTSENTPNDNRLNDGEPLNPPSSQRG
jgi:hypothetical protein